MPHAEELPTPLDIDDYGNMAYPTYPTDTVASEVTGMPMKGGSPRTGQAPASSSAVKPAQPRQRRRSQMPKQSFLDTRFNEGSLDNGPGSAMQLLRDTAPLLTEPHDDVDDVGESSPVNGRAQKSGKLDGSYSLLHRSSQNLLLSMTDEEGDRGPMSDADRSPTPKPGRPTSSRKRRMSDASDMPAPSHPERVESSRQKEMSDPPPIEEHPKRKGIPNFSSTAPSVAASTDNEPLPTIPRNIPNSSSISSQTTNHAKMVAYRQKSLAKSNTEMMLSPLDLEEDKSEDPFDQANIPPSRGISPGTSRQEPKQAPKKQPIAKSSRASTRMKRTSPRAKARVAKSTKVSLQKRQAAKPRQKAKPSAAEVAQELVAPGCGEGNGNDGYLSDDPVGLTSNKPPAKLATVKVPALNRTAKTIKDKASGHQKDVVLISSATESEDSDTDGSDGDEYVSESRSTVFQDNRQPLRNTRTTTAKSRGNKGVGTASKNSTATDKDKEKAIGKQGESDDENDLTSKTASRKSHKDVAQASVTKEEPSVKVQSKNKSTDTMPSSPPPSKTTATQKRGSVPKKQNNPDETGETSFAIKPATRQVKHGKTQHPSIMKSRDADVDRKDPAAVVANLDESHAHQSRVTRQSRGDQSQNDPNLSIRNSKQSKSQAKHTERVSPEEAQDERKRHMEKSKSKEKKQNTVAFDSEGPKNTGKTRKNADTADHLSEQQVSSNSTGLSTSKAAKTEKNPTESNGPAQKTNASIRSDAQSTRSPKDSLAYHSKMQQPSSQVTDQPNPAKSIVDLSSSSEEQRGRGSHALQKGTKTIARKPSLAFNEDENCATSPPVRVTRGKHPAPTQINTEGDVPNGDHYADANDADGMGDIHTENQPVRGIQELLIPDSLEQPGDNSEGPVSMSQMRDSIMISNLLAQNPSGGNDNRKRPLPDECDSRIVLPIQDQFILQSPVDNQAPEFRHQSEREVITDHQAHQAMLDQKGTIEPESASEQAVFDGHKMTHQHPAISQQSAVKPQPSLTANQKSLDQDSAKNQQSSIAHQPATTQRVAVDQLPVMMNQPTWKQHITVSQQPMRFKKPLDDEQIGIRHKSRDFQAPPQETIYHQLPTLNFSQPGPGKESAKLYLQDLSKSLQRPSKRVKLDVPGPDIGSPVSAPYSQFCVPTNGFSSDDVFAPEEVNENTDIDHDVVNQLRGIKSAQYPAAPGLETKRSTGDHIDNRYEPLRLRTSARILTDANHSRSLKNTSQGTCNDGIAADVDGFDLWRRGLLNRRHGVLPIVQNKEQVVVEDPLPYEGVEDVMHRIVAVSWFVVEPLAVITDTSTGRPTGFAFQGV